MTTNTTRPGDRDPHADPADEWDRETTPAQTLATAMRTAAAAQRDLAVLLSTSVYIAGPMTGIEAFNFPAFKAAEHEIEQMGFGKIRHTAVGTPPTPAEARPWDEYLRNALRLMLTCDAVVVLPGWRESKGARLEVHVALELGMPVVEYPDLRPVESIIEWPASMSADSPRPKWTPVPEDEYGTQTAEYLDRRYGTAKPNSWAPIPEDEPHWSDATIDLPKDPEQ